MTQSQMWETTASPSEQRAADRQEVIETIQLVLLVVVLLAIGTCGFAWVVMWVVRQVT